MVNTYMCLCPRGQYLSVPLPTWSIPICAFAYVVNTYLCLCLSGQYLPVPLPTQSVPLCAFAYVVNTYLRLRLRGQYLAVFAYLGRHMTLPLQTAVST